VPLAEQDPGLWDWTLIADAEALLKRAGGLRSIGRYQLEAALQSAHVHRRHSGRANWPSVVLLYDALWEYTGSPVVAINRAIAIAELRGAAAGLAALPTLEDVERLAEYQPYWAARADLLARTGDHDEADRAYEMAIGLERDSAVRRFLQRRQAAVKSEQDHWESLRSRG
jgi:RNA polymerase sigma-70 factor (ECF subfamily)